MSPERLRELATCVLSHPDKEAADALRAFASVVSVLERVGGKWDLTVEPGLAYLSEGYDSTTVLVKGDTPLAAILALADALEKGA